jgi:hypothetical protein
MTSLQEQETALATDHSSHDLNAVITEDLPAFFEEADRQPHRVIILRAKAAPSASELRRYCLALGGIRQFNGAGEVRTVKNDPSIPDSTAMSLSALALHTDGAFLAQPPAWFMLSFSSADGNGGGVSTFVPIARILAAAPDWALQALFTADYRFVRTYDGDLTDSHVGPVLYQVGGTPRIRWRSDDIWRPPVVDAYGTNAEDAVNWLHDHLSQTQPLTHAAATGQTLLVPNTVMLHGRTCLSPGSAREVLRAWVA